MRVFVYLRAPRSDNPRNVQFVGTAATSSEQLLRNEVPGVRVGRVTWGGGQPFRVLMPDTIEQARELPHFEEHGAFEEVFDHG